MNAFGQNSKNITHINTHGFRGGAAKMAWRISAIQRGHGQLANMLVGEQGNHHSSIHSFEIEEAPELNAVCQRRGNLFYAFQGSHRLVQNPIVLDSDIVHLHNLHGDYFNPFSIHLLANIKPVVWTLHDMQPFTGHCAHSFDCVRWQLGCGRCPYLETEPRLPVDVSSKLLSHKHLIYQYSPLWIVTPSNWLKTKVEKSILGHHPIDLIYNGVDTTVFKPTSQKTARSTFNLPQDKLLVGAVANGGTLSNPWKGGEYTQAAVDFLSDRRPDVCFVDIGGPVRPKDSKYLSIPHISDEKMLALAYNALDLLLYTPRADNCPLVVLEAMASGLPIASFDTGGIPEMVVDGQQGCLVQFQDIHGLVQAADFLLNHPSRRRTMGLSARKRAQIQFDQALMAEKYAHLYDRVISEYPVRKSKFHLMPGNDIPEIIRSPVFMEAYRYVAENEAMISGPGTRQNGCSKGNKCQTAGAKSASKTTIATAIDSRFAKTGSVVNRQGVAEMPRISVITPSFNQRPYLEACMRSVLEQDYPHIEYIIMDGGSTDGSREIIEKYSHQLAYWQSKPDKGHYWAIQEGINRSTGDIITWLNSDDQFHPHAFKIVASIFLQRADIEWITGRPNNINADGTKFSMSSRLPIWSRRRYLEKQYHHPFIQQEGTFWRRSLWGRAGSRMNVHLALAGDMELWTRFFRSARLYSVDYNLAAYRTHGDNRALQFMDRYLDEATSVIENELKLLSNGVHSHILPAAEPITSEKTAKYMMMSGFHQPVARKRARPQRLPSDGTGGLRLSIRRAQITGFQFQHNLDSVPADASKNEKTDISLILPTKDRARGLEDVLNSLSDAMQDIVYEIILYTNEINSQIKTLIERYKIQKVFCDHEVFGQGVPFSWSRLMNHAFSHASGTWCMYGSDDIVFYPLCFKYGLSSIARTQDASIGGVSFLHRNTSETHHGVFKDFGYDSLNGDKPFINFGLVRTDAFQKTSGFDEGLRFFWADVDICMQLLQAGYRIIPSLQSLVDHNNLLEQEMKAKRQSLFDLDTAYFYKKWSGSKLFGNKNPLEKVRFTLSDKDSFCIKTALRSKLDASAGSSVMKVIHIVIDGVIFQLQAQCPHGISRVWRNLIPALAQQVPQARITVLQRHGFKVPIQGVAIHDIPAFRLGDENILDRDDEMLHRVCRSLKADIFFSTYYTRAPGVPNMVMVHDMIPELLGHNPSNPEWVAKQRVIETSDAFLCVSQTTRNDLIECYPQVAERPVGVVYNGLDDCFKSENHVSVQHFKDKYGLIKPFLLIIGNRHGYKCGAELLQTIADLPEAEAYSVVCIGGEAKRSAEEERFQRHLDLKFIGPICDRELMEAYKGARAVLVPSKYEGFGLPVIEAMACGCPVIARKSKAVFEVAGNTVCYADPQNPDEIKAALKKIEHEPSRSEIIARGRQRALKFDWRQSAHEVGKMIQLLSRGSSILLTAIVSTYNSARFINGCLKDLMNQSLARQMEVIVIDSASQQDEALVVKRFQRHCPNIKYLRISKRENVYAAWNRGIKFALGKYVTNANTDDRHRRDALEQMVKLLEAKPDIDLVYADAIKTETPDETFERCTPTGMLRWYDWDRETLLAKGCFIGPQPVWRRKVHDTYGYFDDRYSVCGDYEFWLRISQTGSFYHMPQPLGLYLDRPDSIEHANKEIKRREERQISEMYKDAATNGKIIGRLLSGPDHTGHNSDRDSKTKYENRKAPQSRSENTAVSSDQGGPIMHSPETILDAIRYLAGGAHSDEACWFLDKLIADYPDMAAAHSERAQIAYQQDDMGRAQKHYELAAELAPATFEFQKNLGDFRHAVQKDVERALSIYEKALALEPNNVEVLTLAGHLSVSLHRFDQAKQYYSRAVSNAPDDIQLRQYLDKLNTMPSAGQPEQKTDGDLYAIALEKAENGDRQGALSTLKALIDRDAGNALAHNDIGILYYEAGENDNALAHYQEAVRLSPENPIFQKNLGDLCWFVYGNAQAAMTRYMEALKLEPQDVEALLACSQICMSIGRNGDAREFLDCVLTLEPWNEEARQMINRIETADSNENDGLDRGPVNPTVEPQNDLTTQNVQASIDDLLQTITESPQDARAFNDLGVLYFESGDNNRALHCYEQAVSLQPRDAVFVKNLADFYLMEQGRIEDALKMYVSVLEDNPQDVDCLISTGLICRINGRPDDALDFYKRALEIEPWNQSAREALDGLTQVTDETLGQTGFSQATA